ncbi:hypothetical protein D3C73_777850 [compost metagenome]
MPGIEEQALHLGRADHRRAVRRHRAQAGPEIRLGNIATREEIGDGMFERRAPFLAEIVGITRNLRHAADADTVAKPGDGDLVGLVHHGGFRRARGINDRNGQRITLDRIDRQLDAELLDQHRRIAAERHDDGITTQGLAIGHNALDGAALDIERLDIGAVEEFHAHCGGLQRQRIGELETIARLVLRRQKAADDLLSHMFQRRLDADAAFRIEHFVGNTVRCQRLDVLGRCVELLLGTEELKGALHAFVISDAGFITDFGKRDARIIGDPKHAALVDCITFRGAVAQHLRHPRQHGGIHLRTQDQRCVVHEKPFHRLQRDSGCRPGGAVTEGNLTGIGKAGFQRRTFLPVNDGDLMAGLGKLIGGCNTDNAGSENDDFHGIPRFLSDKWLKILALVALAEAGQHLIGNRSGRLRKIVQRLVRPDHLDKAAERYGTDWQGAYINGHAVHRNAADDRLAVVAEIDGTPITEAARQTVGVTGCNRRKPHFAWRHERSPVTNPCSGGYGSRLDHCNLQADDGFHRVGLRRRRVAAIKRNAGTRHVAVIALAEKDAVGVGKADRQVGKFLGDPLHLRQLLIVLLTLHLIGRSEMAHDEADIDQLVIGKFRFQLYLLGRRKPQPRHAGVELQGGGQTLAQPMRGGRPAPQLFK